MTVSLPGTGGYARDWRQARVLLVAAHPDDETLGAGILLSRLRDFRVLQVTDGAPLDPAWWGDPEQPTREAYAALRAHEFRRALACVGIGPDRIHSLGIIDQQASFFLPEMTKAIRDLIREARPDLILTHPYEGGHPDHDACALAVRAAVHLLDGPGSGSTDDVDRSLVDHRGIAGGPPGIADGSRDVTDGAISPRFLPRIAEFTSYHAGDDGAVVTGRFLDGVADREAILEGNEVERNLKARMLACYASQRATLAALRRDAERFRFAPAYDFTRPPHPGMLHYERYAWGTSGPAWRERARAALTALGLRRAVAGGTG